jgi:hypothetical protein
VFVVKETSGLTVIGVRFVGVNDDGRGNGRLIAAAGDL